jgi:hypothetical protein
MIRLGLAGIVAIPLLLGVAPTPSPQPPLPQPTTTSFSDGGVSMSVSSIDCAHPSTTGEDCRLTFHVVNVSDGFPIFTESAQTVYDPAGQAFTPDPAATAAANGGESVTQRLPRGPVISGVLVFALPAGDRIDHIVLHGRPGTTGEMFAVHP